ncbi:MAG: pantoate--beta-alanine ligase [Bacteroidetes bacterium]|nr:pantoate--beta-alanine ligase [Bacteroidota bacterium]
MKIFETIDQITRFLSEKRASGERIGFVPTMGALHDGHLSLIRLAKADCDLVVSSIFVNPTQFNNPEDLKNYPRMPESDSQMLAEVGTDVLFSPAVSEMYAEGFGTLQDVDLGGLEKVMEGAHRPGHFKGVVQVVSKLFDIVQPHVAYFGEKDYQQLAVIRRMTEQLGYNIEIVGCPTIRESDGLAMSSRNLRLSAEERKVAVKISEALKYIQTNWKKKSPEQLIAEATQQLESTGILKPEYIEIADAKDLHEVRDSNYSKPMRAFAAVFCGPVRLIDNISIS